MRRKTLSAAMLTAGLAAGCSSTPERIDLLEDARMVLTLGDVLSDTDRAELKPGADQTMNRPAAFLSDFPERHLDELDQHGRSAA